jgi:hypothetical protein
MTGDPSEAPAADDDPFEWADAPKPADSGSTGGGEGSVDAQSHPGDSDPNQSDDTDPDVTVVLGDQPSEPLGGWNAVAEEPPDDGSGASDPSLDAPPGEWRDADPTGARWWWVLTRTTQASAALLLLWSVPLATVDLTAGLTPAAVTSRLGVVALALVAAVVRFVLLPVALFADARLVRRIDDVAWSPNRAFYAVAGALFATGTCLYYLYKRQRYVGNPRFPVGGALLRYEGQSVASNWWVVVVVAVALGSASGGVSTAMGDLPLPAKLLRVALGGPALSIEGATSVIDAFGSLPKPVDVAVGAPVLAVGGTAVFLRFVALPLAFYNDAVAVRRSDAEWDPLALWYAVAGWVVAVPTAVFYLARRVRYTDLSVAGGLFGDE